MGSVDYSYFSLFLRAERDVWDAWSPPLECTRDCAIRTKYQAPALLCRNLLQEELDTRLYHGSGTWEAYSLRKSPSSHWGAPYETLTIDWVPSFSAATSVRSLHVETLGAAGRVECEFLDTTFIATIERRDGIKSAAITTTSTTNDFSERCMWEEWGTLSLSCKKYALSARALNKHFIKLLNVTARWDYKDYHYSFIRDHSLHLPRLTNLTIVGTPNRRWGDEGVEVHLEVNSDNFARDIMDLYQKSTLIAMLEGNQSEIGPVSISDGSVWSYSAVILWSIYGPSLAILTMLSGYGLYTASILEWPLTTDFSTLFTVIRRLHLDRIYCLDPDAMMEKYLRYERAMGKFVSWAKNTSNLENNRLRGCNEQPSLIRNRWTRTVMITSFVAAASITTAHHIFLLALNNHRVEDFWISQFWVRNFNNAAAQCVALCLGVPATLALTQIVSANF